MQNLSHTEPIKYWNYQILSSIPLPLQILLIVITITWSEVYLYIFKSIKTFLLYVRKFVAVVTL
jgi:hypothetical protein